jgi:hypothetical protein
MLRSKHRLIRDGAQGEAAVVGEQRRGAGTRDWRQYIDARFETADGSVVEFTGHIPRFDLGNDFLKVGDLVPVRYDPDDHRQIALDIPRLKAQIAARAAGSEPVAPAASGATVAGIRPGAGLLPLTADAVAAALDAMAELGELHYREALSDDEYTAEKTKLKELMRRRVSGAISEAEFEAENTERRAGLPPFSRR